MASQLPVARRVLFGFVTTVGFLLLTTVVLTFAERCGWIDPFRKDDSVLYLQGQYLRLDGANERYTIADAQAPTVVQASFAAKKPRNTIRIFITGESFVRGGHQLDMGSPPAGFGTIADWMREVLERRYPSRAFEIVNAGANGQSSNRIAAVVEELVHADPDVIVVAMGNNEGVQPRTGVNDELNQWLLYRVLKKAVMPEPTLAQRPPYQLQTMGGGAAEAAFRRNLERIVASTKRAHVPLVLATLPLNLLEYSASYTPEERAGLTSDAACAEVDRLAKSHSCDAAIEAGTRCATPAFASVSAADCLRDVGRDEEARELYKVAIQLDPRGRTRPSYNARLREVAAREGLQLVDLEAGMEARSEHGLPGQRWFIDHVHLTCMGYLPIAQEVVQGLIAGGYVSGLPWEPRPWPTAAQMLSEEPWPAQRVRLRPSLVPGAPPLDVCAADPEGA